MKMKIFELGNSGILVLAKEDTSYLSLNEIRKGITGCEGLIFDHTRKILRDNENNESLYKMFNYVKHQNFLFTIHQINEIWIPIDSYEDMNGSINTIPYDFVQIVIDEIFDNQWKCKWCEAITNNFDEECDHCYELKHKIEHSPKIAEKILNFVLYSIQF